LRNKTKLKKDYITFIAIFLLAGLIIFEILLATYLPSQLKREELWEREVAIASLISLQDSLRSELKGIKFEESKPAKKCLDSMAIYIRDNSEKMTREQISTLKNDLIAFEPFIRHWDNKKTFVKDEKLDLSIYIEELKNKVENE